MSKYMEPWKDDTEKPNESDYAKILCSDDELIVGGCGCCGSPWISPENRRRIIVCVNACAGVDNEVLEKIIAGEVVFAVNRND